jgi:cytochrome c-type biogenesis protein CcmH
MRALESWSSRARVILVLASLSTAANVAHAEGPIVVDQPPAPGEITVERRLLAPCCWNQTLDVHESDLATSLRHEIRARLHAGEAQSAIEDSLAARYGEKIRAVERGRDPGGAMPFFVGFAALFAGGSLVALLRRWRRAGARIRPVETTKPSDADSAGGPEDARLDDELRALDQ